MPKELFDLIAKFIVTSSEYCDLIILNQCEQYVDLCLFFFPEMFFVLLLLFWGLGFLLLLFLHRYVSKEYHTTCVTYCDKYGHTLTFIPLLL